MLGRTGFEVVETYGFGFVPSFHGRLLVPVALLDPIERRLSGGGPVARLAKNRLLFLSTKPGGCTTALTLFLALLRRDDGQVHARTVRSSRGGSGGKI